MLDESFEFDPETMNDEGFLALLTKKKKGNFEGNYCDLSFFVFSKRNPMRIFFYKMQNHFIFEGFIQFFILLSSIKLVLDSYKKQMPQDSIFFPISDGADYFFTVIFALEFMIKAISLGFMMEKGTYIRDTWS